jgi:hypothetical protein
VSYVGKTSLNPILASNTPGKSYGNVGGSNTQRGKTSGRLDDSAKTRGGFEKSLIDGGATPLN